MILLEPSCGPAPAFGHLSPPGLQDFAGLSLGILVQQAVGMPFNFGPRTAARDIARPVGVQFASNGRGVLVKDQEPAKLSNPATKLCHAARGEGSAHGSLTGVKGLDKARQGTLRPRHRRSTKGPTVKAGRTKNGLGVSTEVLPFLFCAAHRHIVLAPSLSNSGPPRVTGHAIRRHVTDSGAHHATTVKDFVLLDLHLKKKMIAENLFVKRGLGSLQMLSNKVIDGSPLSAGRARVAMFIQGNTGRKLIPL